jgi:carboxylesterase type B
MSIRRVTSLLSFALMACGPLAAGAQKPACSTGTIQTSSGPVCGMTSSVTLTRPGTVTAAAYLGIPYAVPPIGSLRWQYSTPFKGSAPLPATAYGNECPQALAPTPSAASSSRCTDGKALGLGESEDCLYLNVWVPSGTTASSRLPVMAFIHGGAFYQGSGGSPSNPAGMPIGNLYDGTDLAATGKVIVVTFNYRLGALGFLAQGGKYNFGFADQLLALHWVRTNIANFGGNPHDVTLFGESAGAKAVGLHVLASPRSAGLFQAAIMESNALGLPYKNTSQTQKLSREFCASGSSLCTTATSTCDLVEAQNDFMKAQPLSIASLSNYLWEPTIDNIYVTGQPIASAASLSVPLVLGTNHDEGIAFVYPAVEQAPKSVSNPPGSAAYAKLLDQQFGAANSQRIRALERYHCGTSRDCTSQLVNVLTDFAFTCANRHLAIQATQRANPRPLYLYQFDQVSSFNLWAYTPVMVPQCNGMVCHADELPYVFNTTGQISNSISFTPPEESLAQTMGGYWTSFAHRRDPGGTWPLFKPNRTYRLLDTGSSTAKDPVNASANCSRLWDRVGYESQTSTRPSGRSRP